MFFPSSLLQNMSYFLVGYAVIHNVFAVLILSTSITCIIS